MTVDELFLFTLEDLEQRVELGRGEYDALMAAWLLRKLLLDELPLIHEANRSRRLKLRFRMYDDLPDEGLVNWVRATRSTHGRSGATGSRWSSLPSTALRASTRAGSTSWLRSDGSCSTASASCESGSWPRPGRRTSRVAQEARAGSATHGIAAARSVSVAGDGKAGVTLWRELARLGAQ
jgi:hypothetical protein